MAWDSQRSCRVDAASECEPAARSTAMLCGAAFDPGTRLLKVPRPGGEALSSHFVLTAELGKPCVGVNHDEDNGGVPIAVEIAARLPVIQ
jgi:hypothetical protein